MPGGRVAQLTRARESDTRRRAAELRHLTSDGQPIGPELPDDHPWHPRTRAWWDTWRRSPMARAFHPLDWDHLALAAVMHSRMWDGELSAAAEVRMWSAKFGGTPVDRMRLRWVAHEEYSL